MMSSTTDFAHRQSTVIAADMDSKQATWKSNEESRSDNEKFAKSILTNVHVDDVVDKVVAVGDGKTPSPPGTNMQYREGKWYRMPKTCVIMKKEDRDDKRRKVESQKRVHEMQNMQEQLAAMKQTYEEEKAKRKATKLKCYHKNKYSYNEKKRAKREEANKAKMEANVSQANFGGIAKAPARKIVTAASKADDLSWVDYDDEWVKAEDQAEAKPFSEYAASDKFERFDEEWFKSSGVDDVITADIEKINSLPPCKRTETVQSARRSIAPGGQQQVGTSQTQGASPPNEAMLKMILGHLEKTNAIMEKLREQDHEMEIQESKRLEAFAHATSKALDHLHDCRIEGNESAEANRARRKEEKEKMESQNAMVFELARQIYGDRGLSFVGAFSGNTEGGPPNAPSMDAPKVAHKQVTLNSLIKKKKADLQNECSENGLSASGNKPELIERLYSHYSGSK